MSQDMLREIGNKGINYCISRSVMVKEFEKILLECDFKVQEFKGNFYKRNFDENYQIIEEIFGWTQSRLRAVVFFAKSYCDKVVKQNEEIIKRGGLTYNNIGTQTEKDAENNSVEKYSEQLNDSRIFKPKMNLLEKSFSTLSPLFDQEKSFSTIFPCIGQEKNSFIMNTSSDFLNLSIKSVNLNSSLASKNRVAFSEIVNPMKSIENVNKRCESLTMKGVQCKNKAFKGSVYCNIHMKVHNQN